jgi:hypothetical protein
LGNPPFLGKQYQNKDQKDDMDLIFREVAGAGVLDYVTAWYMKASQYLRDYQRTLSIAPATRVAFVSTNSITQGEQVGILWGCLTTNYEIKIQFAHRTFRWTNEAKGIAAVHCVIIGFSNYDTATKYLFDYQKINDDGDKVIVKNINGYLVDAGNIVLRKLREPLCKVPFMTYGSMPNDGGNLLMDDNQMKEIVSKEPGSKKYIRPFVMGEELISCTPRYCFWLLDADPSELKKLPVLMERVNATKEARSKSSRPQTQLLAALPTLFGEIRQPSKNYLALPRVSSVNRRYIPMKFLDSSTIAGDKVYTLVGATCYHFGILESLMHMSWMKYTAGRLKSDYSYSNSITYNNYPWPEAPSDKQKQAVEAAAQAVLDARSQFPESSLADLYDPNTMPPLLVKAHQMLDKAVDLCYRQQPFMSEAKRIEFLFELYEKYTSGLFVPQKKERRSKK